ncbi:immunoglobulin light chain [Perkinsela sp. CCAP 1560/4]|nr:immunoglobulin light chain [Perkinsela sp. CCAP 1560/4]|eukprot:KNH03655.1 immunoglobulin light chain [Perkinsela sp. CCAP 1560/4]
MKLQSLIASLERKVNSVHVPIRPKSQSYIIPENNCLKSENIFEESQTLGALEEEGKVKLNHSRTVNAHSMLNQVEDSSKERNYDSDGELKSLSIASQIFTSCDSQSEPDSPTSLLPSKQDPRSTSKQNQSKVVEGSDDSDALSDSDLSCLARHKNWERQLSQRTNPLSEPSQSQRSVGKSREVPCSTRRTNKLLKRTFLHDELKEWDNSENEGSTPTSLEPIDGDSPLSTQSECQRYLQNRKKTWEIRSLNPEHSQHIITSSYVLQELEKSAGHTHPSIAGSRKRYANFGVSYPSMSQGAPQHSSVPMDETKLRLFSESLSPSDEVLKNDVNVGSSNVAEALGPITEQLRQRPDPVGRTKIDPQKLQISLPVVCEDADPSRKLKFPRNFQAE